MSINLYKEIISAKNLFCAWKEFRRGKAKKVDVMQFEYHLEQNIFKLHRDLKSNKYKHGSYKNFYIDDPKRRHIHKATVRDRVLHHAIYSQLYSLFNPAFIATSFSCRIGKGTHKGVLWLAKTVRKVSRNYTKPCFVLKCDIKKFFDSVDHSILINILKRRIKDKETMWLLEEILGSFSSGPSTLFDKKGLPIGNLTSQLFANVYMNELDQFVKQKLKVKYYARYTDDFVIVSDNKKYLKGILEPITTFISEDLELELHPHKVSVNKLHNGIDFLGYVVHQHHRTIRTKTKNRMVRKFEQKVRDYNTGDINEETLNASLQSYLGVLSHANAYKVSQDLKNKIITTD